jgi:hypothetical protein
MPNILKIAKRLDLDAEAFEELVSEGKLDGVRSNESCLARVRRELFGKPPPKRRDHGHD